MIQADLIANVSITQGSEAAAVFGTVQLISQRRVGKGVYEDWARFTLHVDTACEPETVQVRSGDGGIVSGSRYRLQVQGGPGFSGGSYSPLGPSRDCL